MSLPKKMSSRGGTPPNVPSTRPPSKPLPVPPQRPVPKPLPKPPQRPVPPMLGPPPRHYMPGPTSTGLGIGAKQMLQPSPKGLNLQALEKYRAGPQPDSDNFIGRGGNGMTVSQNMGNLGFSSMGGMDKPMAPRMMSELPPNMPPPGPRFKKGGKVSASSRADGIAQRGKTKGRMC